MQAIMVGTLVWGALGIPVRVYAAKEEREGFTLVCRECLTPLQQRRWCPACGVERTADQTLRAVKRGDRYEAVLAVGSDDPEARGRETTERVISVLSFAVRESVDPVYFDRSYFLEPADPAEKGFRLFRRALESTGRVALGRTALRQRESPVLVRPYGRLLMLHTLNRSGEIRRTTGLATGSGRVGAKELQALALAVEAATRPFDPAAL